MYSTTTKPVYQVEIKGQMTPDYTAEYLTEKFNAGWVFVQAINDGSGHIKYVFKKAGTPN